MKIIINATNQIEDRPLREVERLINLGKGHLPEKLAVSFPGYVPSNLDEEPYKTDEVILFREPEIIEIDREYEKLPEVTEANANEFKIGKPIKKPKKKQ